MSTLRIRMRCVQINSHLKEGDGEMEPYTITNIHLQPVNGQPPGAHVANATSIRYSTYHPDVAAQFAVGSVYSVTLEAEAE